MQERYFPLFMLLINGNYSETSAYGKGWATPEEAHQEGLKMSNELFKIPMDNTWGQRTYTDRVQSLWVPIQQS